MEEKKVKVLIYECERGWGTRLDEVKEFNTRLEAEVFAKKFNAPSNKKVVPNWYMYARIDE